MTAPIILTIGLALLLLSLALLTISALTVLLPSRKRRYSAAPRPPISVLKPLKGATPDLYDNLAAFARQRYPRFELVFGAADPDDPALVVADRVRRDFPSVPISIVCGAPCSPRPGDLNPKVSNLAGLTEAARHEWLLVSDADVRPGPDYLSALASEVEGAGDRGQGDRPVGLVASLLVGTREESLGAAWDALHLAGWVTPAISAAERLARHVCVVGKSMLMPRAVLVRAGGWSGVRDVLAEDYVLGRRIHEAGYRVVLSRYPVTTVDRRRSVRSFLARHLRWAQMRARVAPVAYAAEPLLNPVALALAWTTGLALGHAPVTLPLAALAAVFGLKIAADALLTRRLRGTWPAARHLATIPLKDLAIFFVWAVAAWRRTIVWRGTRLVIGRGSRLRPLRGVDADSRALPVADRAATRALRDLDWDVALRDLDWDVALRDLDWDGALADPLPRTGRAA